MLWRFASATAVASVAIALASVILRLSSLGDLETRALLTAIWCVLPVAWGLWALLTPESWLPERLPAWGAILGVGVGAFVAFVVDLPSRFAGEPLPAWLRSVGVPVAVVGYYLLWLLVRRAYRALESASGTA